MKKYNYNIQTITLLFFIVISYSVRAQQDPQFTQYMYNMSVVNPAYATTEQGLLNLGGTYRTQWVGLEGAPRSGTFFAHTPFSDKIELGLSITNDNIGDIINESNIFADFAYLLKVSEESSLSLGLKAGVSFFNANFDGFLLQSGDVDTDIAFNDNINKTFPNIGIGAYYFTDQYYIGLSAPNLLKSQHLENEDGILTTGSQEIHYFLTGGYVFQVNQNVKFKPATMLKGVSGAPFSLDVTANVLYKERLEAGIAYRVGDAVSALANFRVTPQLRVGYAYDFTTSNLSNYSSGSHEIMVLFDIDILGIKKGFDRSPRFF